MSRSLKRSLALSTTAVAAIAATLVTTPAAHADGPGVGAAWVVSVGDSYISGEAGR